MPLLLALVDPGAPNQQEQTLTTQPKTTLLRNSAWSLSNICRGKPKPDFESVRGCLPVMARLLNATTDDETITDVVSV